MRTWVSAKMPVWRLAWTMRALPSAVTSADVAVPAVRYEISSYGIDFDVKGLVERLRQDKVYVPEFQRSFVWRLPDSSRFIESLLLGLPVPGIFLAKDPDSQKLFVIDGQQRLKSLQYSYDGVFRPDPGRRFQRTFRLTHVQKQLIEVARAFDQTWAHDLEAFLGENNERRKNAIDSIMSNRNLIAHGRSSSISVARVREYFASISGVVDSLESQCES